MTKLPTPLYSLGQHVYLKMPGSELAGIVTGYVIRPANNVHYLVRWSDGGEGEHYALELSSDREYKLEDE